MFKGFILWFKRTILRQKPTEEQTRQEVIDHLVTTYRMTEPAGTYGQLSMRSSLRRAIQAAETAEVGNEKRRVFERSIDFSATDIPF